MIGGGQRRLAALGLSLSLMLAGCAGEPKPPPEPQPRVTVVGFDDLPGWADDDPSEALSAFIRSCVRFDSLDPGRLAGSSPWTGEGSAWRTACADARAVGPGADAARAFFEAGFVPMALTADDNPQGLFTGYYEPLLTGRVRPDEVHTTPLLGRPDDLIEVDLGEFADDLAGRRIAGRIDGGRLQPYPDRAAIAAGALAGRGLEIAWVDDPVDKFFLEIQGSGRLVLDDGRHLRVGYAAQNGRPYRAIGRDLVAMGEIPKDQVSMQAIRAWLKANPGRAQELMNRNPSYVFFQTQDDLAPQDGPLGALGVPLIPGRSIAVDRRQVPLGAPVFVATTLPLAAGEQPFRRLLVAQDVGGAIRGIVRGDLFMGTGAEAGEVAGRMRQPGRWWILVPRESTRAVADAGDER